MANVQLDLDRWLARVRELEGRSRETKTDTKDRQRKGLCVDNIPVRLAWEKSELTTLYSLRAHLRGRLHMTSRRVDGHGSEREAWTLEDQAKLVERELERWTRPIEPEARGEAA